MKIFVTGATGYVGSVVAERLRQVGHRIVALSRSEGGDVKLRDAGFDIVRGDLSATDVIEVAARDADAVVHAAYSFTPDGASLDQDAVSAILEALTGSGKAFLYTSGAGVYGETGQTVVGEDDAPEPERAAPEDVAAWMRQRITTERFVLGGAARDVRTVVIRPGLVYGRGAGPFAALVPVVRSLGRGVYIGTGDSAWSTVHVDDLADLYLRALDGAPAGTLLNVSSGEPVTMRDIAVSMGRGQGFMAPPMGIPVQEARQSMGITAAFASANIRLAEGKAGQLLGWRGERPSVLHDLELGSYAIAQD